MNFGSIKKLTLLLPFWLFLFSFSACQNEHQHSSQTEDKSTQNSVKTELPVPIDLPEKDGMRLLPGSEFLMGSDKEMPNEAPVHKVKIKPFWIDKTEVTVGDFEKFDERFLDF